MKKKFKPAPTFDYTAFTFDTPVETLVKALADCNAELFDLLEYQQPNAEQKKRINDLCYWLGAWEYTLPDLLASGDKTVKTCAVENRVLGIYTGKKRGKK